VSRGGVQQFAQRFKWDNFGQAMRAKIQALAAAVK
jgi:hypothetical protein